MLLFIYLSQTSILLPSKITTCKHNANANVSAAQTSHTSTRFSPTLASSHAMTTVWSFPAALTGYISGAGALATIILCYVLAVSLGHVEPWLPMISACGVLPPECFLFRAGLVLSGAVFWLEVIAVFNTESATTKRDASLVFGTLSGIGLMVIGVVSDKEASTSAHR